MINIQDKLINHCRKDTGDTIIHVLCQNGHLDCIKYLLSIETNYNTKINWFKKNGMNGTTPFLTACNQNRTETIICLLDNVYKHNKLFNINDGAKNGSNALWFACFDGNVKVISKLFELFGDNIDVNKRDDKGMSPLYLGMFIINEIN